jgi:hypothetical protein
MTKPINELFGVNVSYDETLKTWVAVNNRDQEIQGYGSNAMDALSDYVMKSTEPGEESTTN